MKKSNLFATTMLLLAAVTMSSCEAIAGIFKAGMGFGIVIVVIVIIAIVALVMKMGGKKS